MSLRLRLALLWTLLALLGAGAVVLDAWALPTLSQPRQAALFTNPECYGFHGFSNPGLTMTAFLHAAVERRDVSGSYQLVTAGYRRGFSCRRWTRNPPVAAFAGIDYDHSVLRLKNPGQAGRLVYDVHLFSRSQEGWFVLELKQVGGVLGYWRVGAWVREPEPSAPTMTS
jgi:hypothetical protein